MNLLLKKEFRLAMHPAALCFVALAALLIVPNYPYYVTFFYTTLGIFFICLSGRENRDAEFSLLLPMAKRDIVKARFLTVLFLEIVTLILAIPFAVLRQQFAVPPNAVGMEANIAFFGLALIMLGIFHLTFFGIYYKNIQKVGKAFVVSSAVMFFYMAVVEVLTHVLPFFRDRLDTMDPQFFGEKLAVLAVGVIAFVLFTVVAYKRAVKNFENQDI
ncbi:MAG: ABC-2 transporter permease [Firmicutes bacterium]|nr:ABC-2 transporter permease [Bacillota bacterium]